MSTVPISSLLPGEVLPGSSYCNQMSPLGFLTMKTPSTISMPVNPSAYRCGFNKRGEIIGTNVTIPYPGEHPNHHDIPTTTCGEQPAHQTNPTTLTELHEENHGCPEEIAEYFTAENDEGYRRWAEKKQEMENKKKKQQQTLEKEKQTQHRNCENIHDQQSLGHFMPSRFQTTNQTYGSYIDIIPKYPAVYPLPAKLPSVPMSLNVKIEKSNISNHPAVTNHSFLFNPQIHSVSTPSHVIVHSSNINSRDLITNQCKIQTRKPEHTICVPRGFVGEREKGYTFPVYSKTGLELNRTLTTGQSFSPINEQMVLGKASHLPVRPRNAPYCLRLPRDPRINPHLAGRHIIYEAVQLPQF